MKSIRLLLAGLLFLCFASCSNEDEIETSEPQAAAKGEINFTIGFGQQTKVSTDADFKSKFDEGDEVGFFIVKSGEILKASGNYADNRKLVYNSGEWTLDGDKIYLPVDGASLNIYAYYPYVANVDPTNMTFSVASNQSQANMYNKSDLLLAKVENQNKAEINLQFAHAFSLIQVEVTKGANMVSFDNSLEVTLLNRYPSSSIDLTKGTASVTSLKSQTIVMKRVETDASATKYNFRALVPAQSIGASTELFFFIQETSGKEINNNYVAEASVSLTAGKVSKWKITLEGEPLPEHNYAVGDVYPFVGTPQGIVFEISNGGKNGKIVSLVEKAGRWGTSPKDELGEGNTLIRDADNGKGATQALVHARKSASNFSTDYAVFYWLYADINASDETGAWYLPAKNELKSLYAAMNGLTYEDIKTSWIDAGAMPGFDNPTNIAARTAFNKKIQDAGGTAFGDNGQYWASTEIDANFAFSVKIDTGVLQKTKYKYDTWGRARLIFEF